MILFKYFYTQQEQNKPIPKSRLEKEYALEYVGVKSWKDIYIYYVYIFSFLLQTLWCRKSRIPL